MTEHTSLLMVRDLRVAIQTEQGLIYYLVDGVNIEIKAGETLVVVGESGSGKTVLALSIMQLLPSVAYIASGSILFRGVELTSLDRQKQQEFRGHKIAMIFQDPMTALNPTLSVERQLTEAIEAHKRVSRAQAREIAIEKLRLVGMPDPVSQLPKFPNELSGGMCQRVMIAMALMCDPEILIADEPTTALDVTIQAQILELLRELQNRLHLGILLITHDMGVVAAIAHHVAVMYAGKIIEKAVTETLFTAPQHPYTQGLLASVPKMGQANCQLAGIPGRPPSLTALPSGCRFAPRCNDPRKDELACNAGYPPTREVGHDSMFDCIKEVTK